ncbi:phytochrome E [Tanacetum coccineum]
MANISSVASLVMAILINNNDSMKLWGLVACHHTTPCYIPFPLRYACEFLMQSMGLQLYMELQLAEQKAEKRILLKCDGAALYYHGKVFLPGVTPTESQVIDIANWLCSEHKDSTGFSTKSLSSVGYPDALSLGDVVCGMAAARITSKDFLFWFRSHTENEIKWAGVKHHLKDEDDGERMHPRSREDYLRIGVPLYEASIKCDWKTAEAILNQNTNIKLVRCSITDNGETALHIAASAKGPKKVDEFVRNLVGKMEKEDLELVNKNQNTALYLAAAAGNIETVKIMMAKNPNLHTIPGANGSMMPLYAAVLFGNKDVVRYLYKLSKHLGDDNWNPQNRSWLLEKCVESDMFGKHFSIYLLSLNSI